MPASVPHQAAGRARGEQTRRQLLAAATELFGECGLQGATTRDIAQRAGQNIAAITYYFSSKEGLYLAVAQSLADFIQQAFARWPTRSIASGNSPPRSAHPTRRCVCCSVACWPSAN